MTGEKRIQIETISTGVPGLDEILGGGIPKLSFNVLVGGPGAGKSTLAFQMAFAQATPERPAICFTVLGEPTVKLLRYQQQYSFFDIARVGVDVHVLNLSEEIVQGNGDMGPVLERIVSEVATLKPALVVIDSFRSLTRSKALPSPHPAGAIGYDRFMQLLAHQLSTWEVTAFLVGEFDPADLADPLFTVADGILWLKQRVERNSSMRWIQAIKQRGVPVMAGIHTMRISQDGVRVFPRVLPKRVPSAVASRRVSMGVPELDAMMGGGLLSGDSLVVTGPSGIGKSAFSMEFLAAADQRGEAAVAVLFEEDSNAFLARSKALGRDLTSMLNDGRLATVELGPLDLSVDETLHEIQAQITRVGATIVVIDSLSGFELALAPSFREDFRESIYRLVRAVTATGVTVMMTVEVVEAGEEVRAPTRQLSFLADDILSLRHMEIRGEGRSVLSVVKMRKSRHSRVLREFEITSEGIVLGRSLRDYDSILVRSPQRRDTSVVGPTGLAEDEWEVLQRLVRGDRMTARALAEALAMPRDVVDAALTRMLTLGLAEALPTDDEEVFRAIAQPAAR